MTDRHHRNPHSRLLFVEEMTNTARRWVRKEGPRIPDDQRGMLGAAT
jgi:hypothetical protein